MTGVLAIDTYIITNRYGKCWQRYVENNLTQILSMFYIFDFFGMAAIPLPLLVGDCIHGLG